MEIKEECINVREEDPSNEMPVAAPVESDVDEESPPNEMPVSAPVKIDVMDEESPSHKMPVTGPLDSDVMDEENPFNEVSITPQVQRDVIDEEEIPPAEVVTLFFEDGDPGQEYTECSGLDPLALDANEGPSSVAMIKTEPLEQEQVLRPLVEIGADVIRLKTEIMNDGFLTLEGANSYVETNNDFDTITSLHRRQPTLVTNTELESRRNIRAAAQFHGQESEHQVINSKTDGVWHTTTVKQEGSHLNLLSIKKKSQLLDPSVVKLQMVGYSKCKNGNVTGAVSCENCGKVFNSLKSQWGHLSTCLRNRNVTGGVSCENCGKVFSSVKSRWGHLSTCLRSRRKKSISYRPSVVTRRKQRELMKNSSILEQNTLNETSEKTSRQLNALSNMQTSVRGYKCDVCSKSFATVGGLKVHLRVHPQRKCPDGENLKCSDCKRNFSWRQNLLRHCKLLKHTPKILYDRVDKNEYQSMSFLNNRDSKEERHRCFKCNELFDARKLSRHQSHCHFSNTESDVSKSTKCFSCPVCGQIYKSAKRLSSHMQWHVNGKSNSCPVCGKKFLKRASLKEHKISHRNEGKYCCDMCDKYFYNYPNLQKHRGRHRRKHNDSNEETHPCFKCNELFDDAQELNHHQSNCLLSDEESNVSKSTKVCKCPVCGQTYKSDKRLSVHMQWHVDEKSNTCPVCGKKFLKRALLKEHKISHRKEGKYCCEMCDKYFHKYKNLKQHRRRHNGARSLTHSCTYCQETFSSVSGLWKHVPYCTENNSQSNSNVSGNDTRKLKILRRLHNVKEDLKKDDPPESETLKFENNVQSKLLYAQEILFTCDLCNKTYSSMGSLKRHKLAHPSHQVSVINKSKRKVCFLCGSTFCSQLTLRKHMAKHQVGNGLLCLICKKTFPAARNLKIHLHSHKIDKTNQFRCNMCDKSFSSQIHLKYHRRVHLSSTCGKCHKTFQTSLSLNAHMKFCRGRLMGIIPSTANSSTFSRNLNVKQKIKGSQKSAVVKTKEMLTKVSRPITEISSQKSPHPCDQCGKKFHSSSLLKYHRRQHASEKSLTCFCCKKTFESSFGTKGHFSHCPVRDIVITGLLGRNDDVLQCHLCGKTTNTLENFISHMRTHAKDLSFSCDVCEKVFFSKQSKVIHMSRNHGLRPDFYTCNNCGGNFDHQSGLLKHLAKCDKQNVNISHLQKNAKDVKIPRQSDILKQNIKSSQISYKSPDTKSSVRLAQEKVETENLEIKNYFQEISDGQGREKWMCIVCNKVLTCKSYLKCHIYLHTGESPFKCGRCGSILSSANALKQHMTKHSKTSEQKPLKKQQSSNAKEKISIDANAIDGGNFYNSGSTQDIDSDILDKTYKFQCSVCSKGFDKFSVFLRHEAAHKRYVKCSECGGAFRTLKLFKEHICAIENMLQLCEYCGVQFSEKSLFGSHTCSDDAQNVSNFV